jgi:hypothetical protein
VESASAVFQRFSFRFAPSNRDQTETKSRVLRPEVSRGNGCPSSQIANASSEAPSPRRSPAALPTSRLRGGEIAIQPPLRPRVPVEGIRVCARGVEKEGAFAGRAARQLVRVEQCHDNVEARSFRSSQRSQRLLFRSYLELPLGFAKRTSLNRKAKNSATRSKAEPGSLGV